LKLQRYFILMPFRIAATTDHRKRKKGCRKNLQPFDFLGRDGVIRTHDPLHPMQVRYQAALRPDELGIIAERTCFGLSGHYRIDWFDWQGKAAQKRSAA
jgi:hypothetical protein